MAKYAKGLAVEAAVVSVTPELRLAVGKAVDMERRKRLAMGYNPDKPGGTFADEILPLQERFKSDVVGLGEREVLLLRYLLLEYQGYLQERVDIPLVPDSYTKKVRKSLAFVNSFLETLH